MKKALRANEANKKVYETRKAELEAKNAAGRADAEAHAKVLQALTVSLVRQASEEGKLFGSVTVRDIAENLKEQGQEVRKSAIVISGTIKTTGTYPVKVMLHPEVTVTLNVQVQKSEQDRA
jgi:large subunit ribosomal protein L9